MTMKMMIEQAENDLLQLEQKQGQQVAAQLIVEQQRL